MITELVVKIEADSMETAVKRASERIRFVEAVIWVDKSSVHPGAGTFIAYRYIGDAEIYLGRSLK